jgi:hypothetical protein
MKDCFVGFYVLLYLLVGVGAPALMAERPPTKVLYTDWVSRIFCILK